ncbi:MAG: hypothetical protein P4L77_10850 [Sulfuriferula sp.]|nr:hypothetical protein [Sulfuriferula sp.]
MAKSIADFASQLDTAGYNPAAWQRAALQTASDMTNGVVTIVDASNPVVFATETACALSSYAVSKYATLNRKQYPRAAQDVEDLYLHMSDVDYVNRFAIPVNDTFTMLLPYAELLAQLVLDPTTGIKKVVIPRNTKFTVADTEFCIQYPIEIRQLLHGGIQIVYDTSEPSPLQTITNNLIPWSFVSDGTITYLAFSFAVQQLSATTTTQAVNASVLFDYLYAFNDQFCFARVWSQNADGTWTEMVTTHTDLVYDVNTPTAVLKVLDGVLEVMIPQIYTATSMIKTAVRIDIYTTQGLVNLVLSNYSMGLFVIKFQSFDQNDDTAFSAPLANLSSTFVYSTSTLNGGSNGETFAALQEQVINNSVGPQKIPVSNVNLVDALADFGYSVITSIDNVTDRVFLASKALPTPTNSDLVTAAGTTNSTVSFSLDSITGFSYTIDNTNTQDAITLTPGALFKDVNGIMQLVTDSEIDMISNLPPDQKALVITNGNYYWTPFHYVLDSNNNGFAVRPYYLDAPTIETKLFISDNDTTLLQVNTAAYGIVKSATGYTLQIQTVSGASYQQLPDSQVFVQLSFIPEGEKDRAYLSGTLVGRDSTGKERIFSFDLSSNFNVDANNCLQLTKFLMFTTEPRLVGSPLLQDFDILYSTSEPMDTQWVAAEVDSVIGRTYLPINAVGITHEALRVQFGYNLDTLWARARSVISTVTYQTYAMDIPMRYQADVYQTDPVTGSVITFVNGEPTYTILHHKGDPVLDSNGNQVNQYVAGQPVLDGGGMPIPANPRGMTRQIDFMLIEGVYRFSTDAASTAYRQEMIDTLIGWLTGDLETINEELIEISELYFYPKKTMGQIDVMYGASLKTTIQAGQSLTLTLYVSQSVYGNTDLRDELTTTSVQVVSQQLATPQVARQAILDALSVVYGTDVIDAELTGLGSPAQDLPVFTILDDSIQASLRKKLVAQSDNSLALVEDLTVNFVLHDEAALAN